MSYKNKTSTIVIELLIDISESELKSECLVDLKNMKIPVDLYGIPYLPSSFIKELFGRSKSEDVEKIEEIIRYFQFSNGYIRHYREFRDYLDHRHRNKGENGETLINRALVSNYFISGFIDSIGLCHDDKIKSYSAADKSSPGRYGVFVFYVTYPEIHRKLIENIIYELNDSIMNLLEKQVKIKLCLRELEQILKEKTSALSPANISVSQGMGEIRYEVINLTHCIIRRNPEKPCRTEKFIPGSFILRAVAEKYIKSKKTDPFTDKVFRKVFSSDALRFGTGYPVIGGRVFYSLPASFKKRKGGDLSYDLAYPGDMDEVIKEKILLADVNCEIISPVSDGFLIGSADTELVALNVSSLTYESLPAARRFTGKITGRIDLLAEIASSVKEPIIFNQWDSEKVTGTFMMTFDRINRYRDDLCLIRDKTCPSDDHFIITLASDMISVNDLGFASPDIVSFKNSVADALRIDRNNIEITEKFLNYGICWENTDVFSSSDLKIPAIKAGSVIVFKNNSDKQIELDKLSGNAFGHFQNRGYGQFHVNLHGQKKLELYEESESIEDEEILRNLLEAEKEALEVSDFEQYLYSRTINFSV
jgi:hypothetical protein